MASFENDGMSVRSEEHAQLSNQLLDSNFQRQVPRTESASISIPLISMESQEKEASLKGHAGALISERKTPFVQISSPLYATHVNGNHLQQTVVVIENKKKIKKEKVSHDRENEHLGESGVWTTWNV